MRHGYPMMLDVSDRLVVIVGGGSVALRKAAGLIECGARRVRCVSPEFDPSLPAEVERICSRYEPRHLEGAGLVFAATNDPATNAAVLRDGRSRGVLVNRADADDDEPGDFSTPARLRQSSVTVTVSAGSPALAVLIRDEIARAWDPRWSQIANAMQALRPDILRREVPEHRRREIFRELTTPPALDALGTGGMESLRAWLATRFPEMKDA